MKVSLGEGVYCIEIASFWLACSVSVLNYRKCRREGICRDLNNTALILVHDPEAATRPVGTKESLRSASGRISNVQSSLLSSHDSSFCKEDR